MNLKNTTNEDTRKNIDDAFIFGNDCWKLITKFSSESRGTMKSTKAMQCGNDVVVQVTTQQRNPDGSYSIAEALTTVKNKKIEELADRSSGQILSRRIVELTKIEKQSEKLGEKI